MFMAMRALDGGNDVMAPEAVGPTVPGIKPLASGPRSIGGCAPPLAALVVLGLAAVAPGEPAAASVPANATDGAVVLTPATPPTAAAAAIVAAVAAAAAAVDATADSPPSTRTLPQLAASARAHSVLPVPGGP